MLADQLTTAVKTAPHTHALDDIARQLWRAHADGAIADVETSAVSEAVATRRKAFAARQGFARPSPRKAGGGLPRAARRREKMFGMGRPVPLDRNAKVRIMHLARCLKRRTEAGKHYGALTGKFVDVLEALLWSFHNARSGLCFPSYEKIAEAAHCCRDTVCQAIKALEAAGILTWVNRIKRVRERCAGLLGSNGWRWRALRTSNAYNFQDPGAAGRNPAGTADFSSKSDFPAGTPNQAISTLRPGGFWVGEGRSACCNGRQDMIEAFFSAV